MTKFTILGAGIAGLSCSYHLGHKDSIIFEKKNYYGGHIYSHKKNNFIWDEGPHVSFTKHQYVKDLFADSVNNELLEYEVNIANYYKGSWIPHPAQSNLWSIPENIRKNCLDDFINSRKKIEKNPENYSEWLNQAFGKTFAINFPEAYTKKYWTCSAKDLAIDWIGERIFYPNIETVKQGYLKKPKKPTHYVQKVRYPSEGGYVSFLNKLKHKSNIKFNYEVSEIDLKKKLIIFKNKKIHIFENLINTLPLNEFIRLCKNVPLEVSNAANNLNCSSILLVNVTANHPPIKPFHWLYVYDENKISTRINHVDLLSSKNAPLGKTGVQVEIYFSNYRPLEKSPDEISKIVIDELKEMKLIKEPETVHTQNVPYANVIFDHKRKKAQDIIFSWLEQYGLKREEDDLDPITDWKQKKPINIGRIGLAGRFAQWKYYWSDDCVMRGKLLSETYQQ